MIDHCAKKYIVMHNRHQKTRLSAQQVNKIEVAAARSFTDDADINYGALSAPKLNFRPGQRDDGVNCSFVGSTPIM
jgi:hypothetical protein